MHIYTEVIIDHLGRLFLVVLSCSILLMMMLLGLDQLASMPEAIPVALLAKFLGYELVHISCWVFPIAIYLALVIWAMHASENQFIYRLFHAGWNRRRIYRAQLVWIFPIVVLSILFNLYYLPVARVQQKLLLGTAYQADATLHLERDRFHRISLAGEPWIIFSDNHNKNQEIYAFKEGEEQLIDVMYSSDIGTDKAQKQLVLKSGTRVSIDPSASFPISLWSYEKYGLALPALQLFKAEEIANYEIMIWNTADMDHRLEAYNRVGRIFMGLILSFVPLLLVKGMESRGRNHLIKVALLWYVLYWVVFILCRWILMLDQYQHLYTIFVPHVIMSGLLVGYYYRWVHRR